MKIIVLFFLLFLEIFASSCNNNYRVDCLWGSQSQCESNGCCWDPYSSEPGGYPFCFYSWTQALGYKLTNMSTTSFGWHGQLVLDQVCAIRNFLKILIYSREQVYMEPI
jgi:hypothetical protein